VSDAEDFNQKMIAEFRANSGKVGGPFEGATMVLVHHRGRKSGVERVNPLVAQPLDRGWAIFASKAGALTNPDWYHNLMAAPETTVEVGDEVVAVVAREATGDERELIWSRQKELSPGFADYEQKAAGRVIPVVVLEPAS
jgi:deazaflavin-dependent oxidoreductase (nitroreductase family)